MEGLQGIQGSIILQHWLSYRCTESFRISTQPICYMLQQIPVLKKPERWMIDTNSTRWRSVGLSISSKS